MAKVRWRAVDGFISWADYERFVAEIEAEVAASAAEEVPAIPKFGGTHLLGERWFRHRATGSVWRLMPPDPPMRGLWEPVFPH
jgi:hypothetical protein